MNFTGHNILLDNGQSTMGNKRNACWPSSALLDSIEKNTEFIRSRFVAGRSKLKVVDLGLSGRRLYRAICADGLQFAGHRGQGSKY